MKPKLTVGLTTHDDYDGVFFTINSLRLHHSEIAMKFVVVDQNPTSQYGKLTKEFVERIGGVYLQQTDRLGPSHGRNLCAAEAEDGWILLLDSHVLLEPKALKDTFKWIHSGVLRKTDLLSGPLVYDDFKSLSSHWRPGWNDQCFGTWDLDRRACDPKAQPFEIEMNGVGLMFFHKENWPGYNVEFRGFGAEEWYIHRKYRKQGGRVMCVPCLRWLHRFGRMPHASYPLLMAHKIYNHLLGNLELGDIEQYHIDFNHWNEKFPAETRHAAELLKEINASLPESCHA